MDFILFYLQIKCTTSVSPREIYSVGMFDVVVVSILKFLKLADDGFHKLSEGYAVYMVLQYLV